MMGVGVLRGIAALTNVLFYMAAYLLLPADEYGKLSVEVNTVTFLCVLVKTGFDKYLIRMYAGNTTRFAEEYFGFLYEFAKCQFVVILLLLSSSVLLDDLFTPMNIVSASIYALVFFQAESMRAFLRTKISVFLSGILPFSLITFYLLACGSVEAAIFFGMFSALLLASIVVAAEVRPVPKMSKISVNFGELRSIFIFNLSVVGIASLPIIAAERLVSYGVVGAIQNSFLLAMIIGMVSLVLATYFEPIYAKIGKNRSKTKWLDRRIDFITLISLPCAILPILVIYSIRPDLFELFSLIGCCLFQIMNLLASRYQIKLLMTGAAASVSLINLIAFSVVAVFCLAAVVLDASYVWIYGAVALAGASKLIGLKYYASR